MGYRALFYKKGEGLPLKRASGLIAISVGDPLSSGEMFEASVDRAIKEFKTISICVADSLQRHTLKIYDPSLNTRTSEAQAKTNGEKWIEQHQRIIDKIPKPKFGGLTRWEHWLNEPGYQSAYRLILELYQADPRFRSCVGNAARQYLLRRKRDLNNSELTYDRIFNLAQDYILEESSVYLFWRNFDFNYLLYPKKLNESMNFLFQGFIKKDFPNTLISIIVNFKLDELLLDEQTSASLDDLSKKFLKNIENLYFQLPINNRESFLKRIKKSVNKLESETAEIEIS